MEPEIFEPLVDASTDASAPITGSWSIRQATTETDGARPAAEANVDLWWTVVALASGIAVGIALELKRR